MVAAAKSPPSDRKARQPGPQTATGAAQRTANHQEYRTIVDEGTSRAKRKASASVRLAGGLANSRGRFSSMRRVAAEASSRG